MRKRTLAILIFSLLLCGCMKQDNNEITGTTAATSETSETAADQTSVTEATEITAVTTVTEPMPEIDEALLEEQKPALEELIQARASGGEDSTLEIKEEVFGLLDGEEKIWLAAECGGSYWFTDGESVEKLRSSVGMEQLDSEWVDGHAIINIATAGKRYSYRYIVLNGKLHEMECSGKVGQMTGIGNGVYTGICHDYDKGPDTAEHTWKDYWFYFEDGEFKEYTGENITKADFMQYTGGKAVLDKITAEGGEVTDILYRKNDIVNVNYTVTEDGVLYNKFFTYDVSDGDCKEVKSLYIRSENNYGAYLPSVLNPYTDEQLALHELIENSANGDDECEILNTLFRDVDGDGRSELIAVYGKREDYYADGAAEGELWFASGSIAYKLGDSFQWLHPWVMISAGQVIVNVERVYAAPYGGTDSSTHSFLIKSSTATKLESPSPSELTPDGKYGDLIGYEYDTDYLYGHYGVDGESSWLGQSWKTYWYYFLDNTISEYYGNEITTEEFLKYEGAENVLKTITGEGSEIRSILKRGNGIININYSANADSPDADFYGDTFEHITVRYRNGKVFVWDDPIGLGGIYSPTYDERQKSAPTDFEIFSGMIYDAAEGDENSVLLERFFGDTNNDGKNELYAYYGTEDNYSLWYADENGAEKCEKGYELLTLDGDILLKKSRSEEKSDIIDYYIIRNGRTRRLNAYNAKNMAQTDGNDFSGYITAADALSDSSEETSKEYWFYYRNGAFNEYGAKNITEEEFAEYKGARAFLDEISSMGGDVTGIILRDNGIININYDAHMQETTQHYYLTLKLDDKDRAEDITPRNEDGTLNNKGYYLLSLKN